MTAEAFQSGPGSGSPDLGDLTVRADMGIYTGIVGYGSLHAAG